MSTLSDRIRERLDKLEADSIEPAPEPFAAILAVLELHTPLWTPPRTFNGTSYDRCAGCGWAPYPCPTVAAIASALGVSAPAEGGDQ